MRFLSRAAGSAALVAVVMALAMTTGCNRGPTKPKVAVITNNAFQFWQFAKHGAEDAGKKFDIDVEVKMPPRGNAEEQQQICEDLLVRGVKGIAISSNDAVNMSEFYAKKVAPRVPFVTMDSDVPDPKVRRAYVGTDNYLAGRAAGELVKKAIPDGGKFVIFVGKLDAINAVERRQGVLDELAGIDSKTIDKKTPNDIQNLNIGKYVLLDTRTDDVNPKTCQDRAEDLFTEVGLDVAAGDRLVGVQPAGDALASAQGEDARQGRRDRLRRERRHAAGRQGRQAASARSCRIPTSSATRASEFLRPWRRGDESVLEGLPGHRRRAPHLHSASRHHQGRRRRVPGRVQQAAREVDAIAIRVFRVFRAMPTALRGHA